MFLNPKEFGVKVKNTEQRFKNKSEDRIINGFISWESTIRK